MSTETTTQSLASFIRAHGITASSEMVDENPNMMDGDRMDHYKVRLRSRAGKRLTVFFSMGIALCREPTAADVLDCLASDSSSIENARSFEDWASELGYDADSWKAEHTFKVCERQAEKLKKFLGEEAYSQLLWHTERE